MNDALAATWPAERLILEQVATLQELETWYSLDDVFDRLDALEAWQAAKRKAGQRDSVGL